MKTTSSLQIALLALLCGTATLSLALAQEDGEPAETTQPISQNGGQRLSYLTPDEKSRLEKARHEVFAQNPQLKSEEESLKSQAAQAKSGTPEQRKQFVSEMKEHGEKMKQAMLQVDSSLGPVFQKIEQHRQQAMQNRRSQQEQQQ